MSPAVGSATFAFDAIYEPMHSTAWAKAARDTVTASGAALKTGDHTVDNRFVVLNTIMRVGFEHTTPPSDPGTHFRVQFELAVNSTRYRLWQVDLVRKSNLVQYENWMEWTPSRGLNLLGGGYEIRYSQSMTSRAGGDCSPPSPFCAFGGGDDVVASVNASSGGAITAPSDVLRFNGAGLPPNE